MKDIHIKTGFVCIVLLTAAAHAYSGWTTIQTPGLPDWPYVHGIDGDRIVGSYEDSTYRDHGFLYDGTNWVFLDYPGATDTWADGIDGDRIVGSYEDSTYRNHGFLYDGKNWVSLDYPGTWGARPYGISGDRIVGYYADANGGHGFLYDGKNWVCLDYPGAAYTSAEGIDGDRIVGIYDNSYRHLGPDHGFLYDGKNWVSFDYPGATDTWAEGIDGDRIVGSYWDSEDSPAHGFLYDGKNWVSFDYPGATDTCPEGIDGDRIVGRYWDSTGCHVFTFLLPDIYALCIGVRDNLDGIDFRGDLCARDVNDAISKLVGYRTSEVQTADRGTGKGNIDIRGAIARFKAKGMDANDVFLIYIASHGFSVTSKDTSDPNLLDETTCSPGDEAVDLVQTQISDDLLTRYLSDINDVEKWIILDACHSGGFWGNHNPNDEGDLEKLSNIVLIAASLEDGVTEPDPNGYPYFGRALVEALSWTDGKLVGDPSPSDGWLTPQKLRDYILAHGAPPGWPTGKDMNECNPVEPLWMPVIKQSPDFQGGFLSQCKRQEATN